MVKPEDFLHTDNAILFWAEYVCLRNQNTDDETDEFIDEARPASEQFIQDLEVEPGLYNRKPTYPPYDGGILEAHDNFIGILYLNELFDLGLAEEINDYGRRNRYCYNNKNPGMYRLEAQRPPTDILFYKILAGEKILPWSLLYLIGHIIVSSFGVGSGGKILTYMRLKTLDLYGYDNIFYRMAVWWWKKKTGPMESYFKAYHLEGQGPIRGASDGLIY